MENETGLLIGFDLGTSAIKALLTDTGGCVLALASRRVDILHPEPKIYELEAGPYYHDICSIIRELLVKVENPKDIRALSFCGATGNTILLDKDFNPLGNVINWLDTRTAGKEAELWPELDVERVYRTVGWPFIGAFPLANLGWYKQFKPDVWENARYCAMLNDYIYYRLCGRLVVDPSKATTFYLQEQESRKWDRHLLDFLELDEGALPKILPSGTAAGTITPKAAEETGLDTDTLVVTGSFDHPAAARSTGVFEEGDVLISAGTSWVAFTPVTDRETGLTGKMLVDPFLSPPGCWGAMFSLPAVAEKMNIYLENRIGSGEGESILGRFNRLAGEAEPGAGGFCLNLLKQPYAEMKDAVKNIPEEIQDKNIARALMEGVVFFIRNRVDTLTGLIGKPVGRIVLTGGPTKSPVWPSILADVLGRPVVIPVTGQHAGAMGAVIFAGIGAGIYDNERAGYSRVRSEERTIEPDLDRSRRYQDIYKEYAALFNLTEEPE